MTRKNGIAGHAPASAVGREWIEGWRQDIGYVARSLGRAKKFSLAIVLTLALGFGTNGAILSFLNQVFLQSPSGVPAAGRLRRLWIQQPAGASRIPYVSNTISYHVYRAVAEALQDQAQLALYTVHTGVPLGRGDTLATTTLTYATASYFAALGVHPRLGRWFTDGEADVRSPRNVVVISEPFWRSHFGADAGVIGKTMTVDSRDFTIIGVAGPQFTGIDLQETQLWLPLGAFPTRDVARVSFWDSSVIVFSVFGRINPGVNEDLLTPRATTAYRNAPVTDFATSSVAQIYLRSIIDARGLGQTSREISIGVRLVFVALVILLIAAANVTSLFLARSVARRREVAVRIALGISRARLARLFVIECVLLSLVAGAAALFCTKVTGDLLRSLLLPGIQISREPLGWLVCSVTAFLALVTGIIAGLVTAAHGGTPDLARSLTSGSRDGGATRSFLPSVLVAMQAALSVVLLVGAGLFLTSLFNVEHLRIGYDTPRLAYASVVLPQGERPDTLGFASTMRTVGERLRAIPGVEAVAFAREEPMTGFGRVTFYTATDSSEGPGRPLPTASSVSSNFFKAIGVSFVRGTTFSDVAGQSAASVVVNQTLARTFWPDRDPVGQCIRLRSQSAQCLTVVGVVEDAIRQQLTEDQSPQLYLPIFSAMRGQQPPGVLVLRAEPPRLSFAMTEAMAALHAAFPNAEARVVRMADRLAPQYRPWQIGASLFGVFGLLALLVAGLGIYSNVSYSVSRRIREFGIRLALGATAGNVLGHVVTRGVRPVLAGAAVGFGVAIGSARVVSSLLYETNAWSPWLILGVASSVLVVAGVAACIPGWRATRVDPARIMMSE